MSCPGSMPACGNRPSMNSRIRPSTVCAMVLASAFVVVEATAGLPAVQSGVGHLLEQRARPVLAVGVVLVEHFDAVEDRVDADQVRGLQRAHGVAEAAAEDLVHGL